MKIRKGFVTNSSSSSFIIAYNNDNYKTSIEKQIKKICKMDTTEEYIKTLFDILDKAQNIDDLNDFASSLSEEMYYIYKWELEEELEDSMGYIESREYLRTPEGEKLFNERLTKKINAIIESCKGFDTIKEIHISDDYDPYATLEQSIVENLKECVIRISHH